MIQRLENPNQPNFTTVEGRQPYFHKYAKPFSAIRYADSVTNVLSNGCNAVWYRDTGEDTWCDTAYQGIVPHIKFWYGEGVPEVFTNQTVTANWGVKYYGYFYAPEHTSASLDYEFHFGGSGILSSFSIDGNSLIDKPKFMQLTSQEYVVSSSISLSNGEWHSFELKYKSKNIEGYESGLVALWSRGDTGNPIEKVLMSPSVLSTNDPGAGNMPITFSTVNNYYAPVLKIKEKSATQFSFKVPFVSSSDSYTYAGFAFNPTEECYEDVESRLKLKKYRMIQFLEGYYDTGDSAQYLIRFTGQIRDFKVDYNKDGNDTLEVVCQDYRIFTKDIVNIDIPSPIDYWQVGYLEEIVGHANGRTKPRAFDGWKLRDAYKVLLTESYIDAYSFYQRKPQASFVNKWNENKGYSYFIEPLNSDVDDYLPVNINYGNPNVVEGDLLEADDEYAYKYDTGEFFYDIIDEMLSSWYYKWGFNEQGYPYLRRFDVPVNYKNDNLFSYDGSWRANNGVSSFKGTAYLSTVGSLQEATSNFIGKKVSVIFSVGPTYGTSYSYNTIKIDILKDATTYATHSASVYHTTAWGYNDGVDANLGYNPCIHTITNLPYDEYQIRISNSLDFNFRVSLEGMLIYDEVNDIPVESYYTSDESTSGSVTALEVDLNIDEQRSDCIVLGALTGTKVGESSYTNSLGIVNPNNAINQYVQSSTRDLASVYQSTAVNYIGHPRTTLIFDPSIISQEHADFVSYNVVTEYRRPSKTIDFTIVGQPKLQLYDCVSLSDDYKVGVDTANYVWITSIEDNFDNGYLTKVETSPIKPVGSFWNKPLVDLSLWDNQPIQNFKIWNSGALSLLDVAVSSSDTNIKILTNTKYLPSKGFAQFASQPDGYYSYWYRSEYLFYEVYVTDDVKNRVDGEVILYTSVSTPDSGDYYLRGCQRCVLTGSKQFLLGPVLNWKFSTARSFNRPIEPPGWLIDTKLSHDVAIPHMVSYKFNYLNIGWNPYTQETMGISPIIEFDCLVSGQLRISIYCETGDNYNETPHKGMVKVDNLTGIGTTDYLEGGYDTIRWGTNKRYTWGGFDRIGTYNQFVTDSEIGKGYYVHDDHKQKIEAEGDDKYITYGKFKVIIEVIDDAGNYYSFDSSKDSQETPYIYTNLGPVGITDFKINKNGTWAYNSYDNSYSQDTVSPAFNIRARDIYNANDIYNYYEPVWYKSTANSNRGLQLTIQDKTFGVNRRHTRGSGVIVTSTNPYLIREYAPNITYHVFQYSAITSGDKTSANNWSVKEIDMQHYSGDLFSESENSFYTFETPQKFYFDIRKVEKDDQKVSMIPPSVYNRWINEYKDNYYTANLWISNVVMFSGMIVDRSGRESQQYYDFRPYKVNNHNLWLAKSPYYDTSLSSYANPQGEKEYFIWYGNIKASITEILDDTRSSSLGWNNQIWKNGLYRYVGGEPQYIVNEKELAIYGEPDSWIYYPSLAIECIARKSWIHWMDENALSSADFSPHPIRTYYKVFDNGHPISPGVSEWAMEQIRQAFMEQYNKTDVPYNFPLIWYKLYGSK